MSELPIYPDRGQDVPRHDLERRRGALAEVSARGREEGLERLRVECAFETLRLTGAPVPRELVARIAADARRERETLDETDEKEVQGVLEALDMVEREATRGADLTLSLVYEVHRAANPAEDGSLRISERGSQFHGARPSPPRLIEPKLEDLLEWLAAESCRSLFAAERMTLWLARFVEIAPFEHGNFRTGHLLASFFGLTDGFPPVALRREEAEAIRFDVERAVQFDTLPLVQRFSEALSRSLSVLEQASGRVT